MLFSVLEQEFCIRFFPLGYLYISCVAWCFFRHVDILSINNNNNILILYHVGVKLIELVIFSTYTLCTWVGASSFCLVLFTNLL